MTEIDFTKPCHVFFIGIGGISMSGLAHILIDKGFTVSGSDRAPSEQTKELERLGVDVYYGQSGDNLVAATKAHGPFGFLVYTAAVHEDNPEWIAATELGLPLLSRAELLGQLMKEYPYPVAVAGTHGKTTTTSMLSKILLEAGLDPTLSIGGVFKDIGGNIRVGHSPYFVTEACEYTNSFLHFFPKIGIVLDIDADHLDFFKDLDDIRSSFARFCRLLPKDGALIINADIGNLAQFTDGLPCRVVTYSESEGADYYPEDITFDAEGFPSYTLHRADGSVQTISLQVPGQHNVDNSIAAIAAADLLGVDRDVSAAALHAFTGTNRRFEKKGVIHGVTVIDDYAHHPTEIQATLLAAKACPHNRIVTVFQPHTYTRTKALLEEFAQALTLSDIVVLADIYAARETDTLGVSSRVLCDRIRQKGTECHYFPSFLEIEKFLLQNCTKNDLLITMGAGDVVKIGDSILGTP